MSKSGEGVVSARFTVERAVSVGVRAGAAWIVWDGERVVYHGRTRRAADAYADHLSQPCAVSCCMCQRDRAILPRHITACGYTVPQIEEAVRGDYRAFLEEAAVEVGVSVAELQRWAALRAEAA